MELQVLHELSIEPVVCNEAVEAGANHNHELVLAEPRQKKYKKNSWEHIQHARDVRAVQHQQAMVIRQEGGSIILEVNSWRSLQ